MDILLLLVPLYAFVKGYPRSAKDVQGASNGEVNLSVTQSLDVIQVLEISSPAGISDWYTAPLS